MKLRVTFMPDGRAIAYVENDEAASFEEAAGRIAAAITVLKTAGIPITMTSEIERHIHTEADHVHAGHAHVHA